MFELHRISLSFLFFLLVSSRSPAGFKIYEGDIAGCDDITPPDDGLAGVVELEGRNIVAPGNADYVLELNTVGA